jgi:hypothetical protein
MNEGALAEAAEHLRRAAPIDPQLPEAHYNLGNLFEKQGDREEAAASYRRAISLKPDLYDAHNNLGAILLWTDHLAEAHASFEQAVALKPEHAEAHHNLSTALAELGRHDAALASCRRALALDPTHAHANFSEALLLLAGGDLLEGFEKYEWRWRLGTLVPRDACAPLWNGEDLEGRTILLHAEQGIGDTIHALRYVPLIAARGARVILEVPQQLVRLARRLAVHAQVVAAGEATPHYDLHCPLMALPRAFATTLEMIPANVPYLGADPDAVARWSSIVSGSSPKVGIAWAGNPQHRADAQRSIAIERLLLPLLRVGGVRAFSLQVGERAADLARLPEGLVHDLSPQLCHFAETAAAIANLDLVITVDTALAHLAGALGKPTGLLLHARPDWRWLRDRDDSPWYPTARLFRQPARGDWDGVVLRARDALERLASQPRA